MSLPAVQSALSNLLEKKVATRKTAVETLLSALSQKKTLQILDEYSTGKRKLSTVNNQENFNPVIKWDDVFTSVEVYFDKETKNVKESDSRNSNTNLAFNLVKTVVEKANRISSRPCLTVGMLHEFIIKRVNTPRMLSHFGPALFYLVQKLMSIELYTSLMDAHQWEELLKALLAMVENKNVTAKSQVLDTLTQVIKHCSNEPALIPKLRTRVLDFFKSSILKKNEFTKQYVKAFVELSKYTAIEFRYSLCQLGEEIVLNLVDFLDDDDGEIKKSDDAETFCELFLIQMKLHMPRDTDFNSGAFYAHDLAKWREIVQKLYSFSLDSIEVFAHQNTKHKPISNIPDTFLRMAVKCTKHITQLTNEEVIEQENEVEGDGEPTSNNVSAPKRRKLWKNFNETIQDVCQIKNYSEQLVWLSYITAVLDEYPALIDTESNFSNLMELAKKLINSNVISSASQQIFLFIRILLKCEKYISSNKKELQQQEFDKKFKSWNYIWNIVIRFLSLNGSNSDDSALELLQDILIEWKPSNLDSLLSLYFKHSFSVTKTRLKLLRHILLHCSLPKTFHSSNLQDLNNLLPVSSSTVTSPRCLLLRWLHRSLNSQEQQQKQNQNLDPESEKLIFALQFSLLVSKPDVILKANIIEEEYKTQVTTTKTFRDYDFEDILMMTSFESPLPLPSCNYNDIKTEIYNQCNNFLLSTLSDSKTDTISTTVTSYLQFLEEYQLEVSTDFDVKKEVFVKKLLVDACFDIKLFIYLLNLIDKTNTSSILSNLEEKIANLLVAALKLLLNKINEFLSLKVKQNCDNSEKDYNLLSFVISSLSSICESCSLSCDKIKSLIISKALHDVIQNVFKVLDKEIQHSKELDEDADEEADTETKKDQIQTVCINIFRLLTNYGALLPDNRLGFFENLIKYCMDCQFAILNPRTFKMSTELVSFMLPLVPKTPALIGLVMNLLQQVCKVYYKIKSCSLRLWEIFADIIPVIAELPPSPTDGKRQFMSLLGCLSLFIKEHGIEVCQMAFKTMEKLAQCDRNLSWSYFEPKGKPKTWPLLDVYSYLKIQSVQVTLSTLGLIFSIFDCHQYCSLMSSTTKFTSTTDFTDARKKIEEFFKNIDSATFNLFQSSDYRLGEKLDFRSHCSSVALLCLSRLVFLSPFLQERAIQRIFQLLENKNIDIKMCYRAFQQHQSSAFKIIRNHGPRIMGYWLKEDLMINNFPFELLGFKNIESFQMEFEGNIVITLFELEKTEKLNEFSAQVKITTGNLIKRYFCKLLARHVIGRLVSSSMSGYSMSLDINPYDPTNRNNSRIVTAVGGNEEFQKLLKLNIGELILEQCSLLEFNKDVANKWGYHEIIVSHSTTYENPYGVNLIKEEGFFKSLTLLQNTIMPGSSASSTKLTIMDYLAKKSPRIIYQILLTLSKRVHEMAEETLLQQRLLRLYHFSFFSNLLMNNHYSTFKLTTGYTTPFIIQAYLRFLSFSDQFQRTGNKEEEPFARAVIIALYDFLVQLMKQESLIGIQNYYNDIIYKLTERVSTYPNLMDILKLPLNLLLIEHKEKFASNIASLGPFSSSISDFSEYRKIHNEYSNNSFRDGGGGGGGISFLCNKLSRCLKEMKESKDTCTKERLEFLKKLLIMEKDEFYGLVKNLELRDVRFYEECKEDLVHNLIGVLVQIIQNSGKKKNTKNNNNNNNIEETVDSIEIEAARCLGEIGPINLSVLVLPPYENYNRHQYPNTAEEENIEMSLISRILDYTYEDGDLESAAIAGEVLSNILTLKEFQQALNKQSSSSIISRISSLLEPFKSSMTVEKKEKLLGDITDKVGECYTNDENFNPKKNDIYSSWIIKLTTILISCFSPEVGSLIYKLGPLCSMKVEFCEEVLPYTILCLLQTGKSNLTVRKELTKYFNNFFNRFVQSEQILPSESFEGGGSTVYTNKQAIRCLLKVVQYLRLHNIPKEYKIGTTVTPWDNNFWLEFNYMDIAAAAQYCGAFLSSILYTEIFAVEKDIYKNSKSTQSSEESNSEQFYTTQAIPNPNNNGPLNVFKILLKAYTSIGEEDSPYGCGSARFLDFQSNIQHLEQLQSWSQILYAYDTQGNQRESEAGTCNSLKNLGLYNALWTHLEGIKAKTGSIEQQEVEEVWYECGWRLSKWDINSENVTYLNDVSIKTKQHEIFQKHVYESIQTGLRDEVQAFRKSIQRCFEIVIEDLKNASLESSENIYNYMSKFQMLRRIETILSLKEEQKEEAPGMSNVVSSILKNQNQSIYADFKYQEPVLYMTKTLLSSCKTEYTNVDLTNTCEQILFDMIPKARDAGRLELAEKYASEILDINDSTFTKKRVEIAKNHWTRGNKDIAKHILDKLISNKSLQSQEFYPGLLLKYGEWLYETVAEQPLKIFQNYLLKSFQLYTKAQKKNVEDIAKSSMVVAKYADTQYQTLVDHMQSDLFRDKQALLNKANEEQHKAQTATDAEVSKSLTVLRKQASRDIKEIQDTVKETYMFQELALSHYLIALQMSNKYDLLIFRCISLWLENSGRREENLINKLNDIMKRVEIPPHKFIDVLHQITARLGNTTATGKTTQEVLTQILVKCGEVHPHHTLPIIMTQAMLHKDKEVTSNHKASKNKSFSGQERVIEAGNILEKLRQKQKAFSQLISKLDKLWISFITLAYTNTNMLSSIKGFEDVPIPTINLPVSTTGKYENIIGIKSFKSNIEMVGGINAPKKICCIGTNGKSYNMLLKGNDDLRQDAVMEQVFCAMNKMLANETRTKKRRLLMRVYKVVPLSQRSGVLEWCERTQTFGEYLSGDGKTKVGAHIIYRPTDYKPTDCRRNMNNVRGDPDPRKKEKVFMDITQHFKPVFRYFFFENFKDPGSFFERRLAYTRSVATSSMIGYILGIGDRHVMNLLIDKSTAEVIHIDLGVAFDQGKILPTPETIPFRLTRDIIDGMGPSGVDGVFRRSCEMTLEVLRKNSDIILTILEVLLYDPLYMWTLTEDRKQKIQPLEDQNQRRNSSIFKTLDSEAVQLQNNSAARELRRLRCKLAGIQEDNSIGLSSAGTCMSVEGQVSLLIQNAVDTKLLSKLFPGWQPYL